MMKTSAEGGAIRPIALFHKISSSNPYYQSGVLSCYAFTGLTLKITSKEHPKKQRQIWEYMRLHPEETNYSTIAKGAKVTRHTVAKHFEMIQKMLGIQETAPHPLLDCQTVPLMV